MAEELSIDDAKALLALCASGRLYAVEAWIGAGRSLQVPRVLRKTPLQVAFATGFHSLIERLLRHAPNQQTKNEALREAVHRRRSDLIDLALTHGAEIGAVPFVDVLGTADKSVVSTFLSRGADPVSGFPFAHAIRELKAKTTLGMYLDCRRQYPEIAGTLQQQADMALRQFCCDGNLKWVSLLLWAGADPRSSGPLLEHAEDEHAQDPETHTTAFDETCTWGHTDILKKLPPTPRETTPGPYSRKPRFLRAGTRWPTCSRWVQIRTTKLTGARRRSRPVSVTSGGKTSTVCFTATGRTTKRPATRFYGRVTPFGSSSNTARSGSRKLHR